MNSLEDSNKISQGTFYSIFTWTVLNFKKKRKKTTILEVKHNDERFFFSIPLNIISRNTEPTLRTKMGWSQHTEAGRDVPILKYIDGISVT